MEYPWIVVECLMDAMCNLTLLCELKDDMWVAYRIRVCSEGGLGWRWWCSQKVRYDRMADE